MSNSTRRLVIGFTIAAALAGSAIYYGTETAKKAFSQPPCAGQCADVNQALEDFKNAGNDKTKQDAALGQLTGALPQADAAMQSAQKRIEEYKAANGGQEPKSVLDLYGAKKFQP